MIYNLGSKVLMILIGSNVSWVVNVNEWISCLTSQLTIFQSYRCVGGLKKKLDLRSGSQRHRHFVGFFNVPVQAPTRDHPFYMVIPTPDNPKVTRHTRQIWWNLPRSGEIFQLFLNKHAQISTKVQKCLVSCKNFRDVCDTQPQLVTFYDNAGDTEDTFST